MQALGAAEDRPMSINSLLDRGGTLVRTAIDFGLVAFIPSYISFFAFHAATRLFPPWGRAVIAAVLFCVLLGWVWFLTGERMNAAIRAHRESRTLVWFPLAASIEILFFAMYVFAATSAVLIAFRIAEVAAKVKV